MVGPDRCGKTEIAKALSKRLGISYFKASSEHQAFLSKQEQFINDLRHADPRIYDLLAQTGLSIIFDRGYPCEAAYSKFFKRLTDENMLQRVDELYASLNAKIIICTRASFNGIQDDLNPNLDETALQQISDLYMEFAKWTKCQTHILYVDDEDINRELSELLNFLGV